MTALVPPLAHAGNLPSAEEASVPVSFDSVYAEHFPFVWRCLRALGVAPHALDDAAQDVFVVVHRQLPAFAGESTVRTWLYGIVRNVASNHRRARARKGDLEPLGAEPMTTEPGPHDTAQEREAAEFIRRFVDGLDDRKRDVFVLCLLEELSVPEAAEALAIPLNTAYTRLRRVRVDFRRALLEQRDRHDESG